MSTLALPLLAIMALTPSLAAQDTSTRSRIRIIGRDGQPRIWIDGEEVTPRVQDVLLRRARLGVTVELVPSAETDTIGARISAVTPGGPAARAGIRSGDIITRLNGQRLVGPGTATSPRDGESAPGARLIEIAAKLGPGDTVTVEYSRDGRRTTTSLVTANEPGAFAFTMRDYVGANDSMRTSIERILTMPEFRMERLFPDDDSRTRMFETRPNIVFREFRGALADLELTTLNPDLAAYFGTAEGILVIRVPEKSPLGLKGGDVILNLDGRKPSSPGALLRILRTYEPEEEITFEVLRLKKRETVTGTIGR
jgi:S1-C subfamily serine protease